MKYIIPILLLLLACSLPKSDTSEQMANSFDRTDLIGAWATTSEDSLGSVTGMAIVTDGYFSVGRYSVEGRRFVSTVGGTWELDSNKWAGIYEYNTADSTSVGQTVSYEFEYKDDQVTFTESGEVWKRVDDGSPGALSGAWLITGRERDGEISRRTPGVRKTMKILSGTRFQWIAYNTETGQFFGTGGGTYSTTDSVYTEQIEFFSRNADRIGAELEFSYAIDSAEWHHRGFSSSGDPMYEIWTPRSMLD